MAWTEIKSQRIELAWWSIFVCIRKCWLFCSTQILTIVGPYRSSKTKGQKFYFFLSKFFKILSKKFSIDFLSLGPSLSESHIPFWKTYPKIFHPRSTFSKCIERVSGPLIATSIFADTRSQGVCMNIKCCHHFVMMIFHQRCMWSILSNFPMPLMFFIEVHSIPRVMASHKLTENF